MIPANLHESFWDLGFGQDAQPLRRRLAGHLYGDETVEFTVTLFPVFRNGRLSGVELELKPAPRRQGLTFVVDFPTGQRLQFPVALPVAAQGRPPEQLPAQVRSPVVGPVVEADFDMVRAQWIDGAWPPFVQIFNK